MNSRLSIVLSESVAKKINRFNDIMGEQLNANLLITATATQLTQVFLASHVFMQRERENQKKNDNNNKNRKKNKIQNQKLNQYSEDVTKRFEIPFWWRLRRRRRWWSIIINITCVHAHMIVHRHISIKCKMLTRLIYANQL